MVSITAQCIDVALGGRTVVTSLEADVTSGGLVGIIGPNGAGKSTLIRAMLGLIPVAQGRVLVDGEDIATLARRTMARKLAYLPQGQTLHWPLTVERLVALGRMPHLAPLSRIGSADQGAIEEALGKTDTLHLRDRCATSLSGGERARILLARALAVQAEGLIADEPLASLDPGHQIDIMEMLQREARSGTLVIAVLHDLTMAARYCDRLLVLQAGRLVADGRPEAILTPDMLRSVYGIEAHFERVAGTPYVVTKGREGR